MNQILNVKNNNSKYKKYIKLFIVQFILSISLFYILVYLFLYKYYNLNQEERISRKILNNYDITRLYINNKNNNNSNNIFGIIEIKKINVYYPIFNTFNDDLLKIAPCKIYGKSLDENDNICIAGHNYDNNMFFSKISSLGPNDEINIFNTIGKKYKYFVYDIYEVRSSDLSPIIKYNSFQKTLTLITCNNLNSNRIIVKAKQKASY